jgi:hypothetical protein
VFKVILNRAALICGASLIALCIGAPAALAQGLTDDGDGVLLASVTLACASGAWLFLTRFGTDVSRIREMIKRK